MPEQSNRLEKLIAPRRRRDVPGAGYTRFVRLMRLVLPVVALVLVAVLFAWPNMDGRLSSPPEKTAAAPQTVGRNELVKPRFESADRQNRPFTVTADNVVQNANDPDVVMLDNPAADMKMTNGAWLAARAQKGAYRQNAEKLLLEGDVRLFHDSGYEMKTAKLLVDMKGDQAWSDQPVHVQGPAGVLDASGLQVKNDTGLLVFTGPAKLVLNRAVKGL